MLARNTPRKGGSDFLRTFKSPKCDYVHKVVVEDPLRSADTEWTNSELKPPT